ncbi:nuclease-related domain-containing protein [Demequina sp. NBRC 110053]|uniref:nuclease-related domain-containing protein n=1 Tax=Demequina sp. NBRC 110053 TaxID=1570342 RepID=UPI000A06CA06|nr:nuclease-related domain-containing protein [Demequina sp. NBRC 110053]
MELPVARRYRKAGIDRLYVGYPDGDALGWCELDSGLVHAQVPGAEARIEAAADAWAKSAPDDDLANHEPGRNLRALTATWDAEIAALQEERTQIDAMIDAAYERRGRFMRGLAGEQRVGAQLNHLYEAGWGILHSLPLPMGGDLDHLLIGPGGIWTVNSKAHESQSVFVNGDYMRIGRVRVDHVAQARREAVSAQRVLSAHGVTVDVRPMVVLILPPSSTMTVRNWPVDVRVVPLERAVPYLLGREAVWSQADINQAFAVARVAGHWQQ